MSDAAPKWGPCCDPRPPLSAVESARECYWRKREALDLAWRKGLDAMNDAWRGALAARASAAEQRGEHARAQVLRDELAGSAPGSALFYERCPALPGLSARSQAEWSAACAASRERGGAGPGARCWCGSAAGASRGCHSCAEPREAREWVAASPPGYDANGSPVET